MVDKEMLKKQLIELTKQEMNLIENRFLTAKSDIFDEIEKIHQKRMGLWRQITEANEKENQG